MLSSLLIFISSIMAIGWSFPFIIAPLIGMQFYIVSEHKVTRLLKKIPKYSSLLLNDEADGWIIGWPFIGYIFTKEKDGGKQVELYLFTTKKYFEAKIKEISTNIEDENIANTVIQNTHKIKILDREGTYSWFRYSKRITSDMQCFKARPNQQLIIDNIMEYYKKNKNGVILLHGEKGIGKSMIPILLAKEFVNLDNKKNTDPDDIVSYCDTFNPTDPGDSFITLYNTSYPTKNTPLIIVFEEVDIIIKKIHNTNIERHKNSPIMIRDKTSWNQFFDRFDRKYYPYTIIMMTTNETPDYINNMDLSYIRDGRVNQIFHVT
jgi:hypothetical protein